MSVTKSELIASLSRKMFYLSGYEVKECVNTMLELMSGAICNGDRIEIRGFGSFERRLYEPRKSRNPKTGEPLMTTRKYGIHFKTGKEMRKRISSAAGKPI